MDDRNSHSGSTQQHGSFSQPASSQQETTRSDQGNTSQNCQTDKEQSNEAKNPKALPNGQGAGIAGAANPPKNPNLPDQD